MAYQRSRLKKFLSQYSKILEERINIDKIILFGSYAYGSPTKWSDIDIAVISPDFKKQNDFERTKFLLNLSYNINLPFPVDIEVLGFTPEEFNKPHRFSILEEIKEKGKIISPKKRQ